MSDERPRRTTVLPPAEADGGGEPAADRPMIDRYEIVRGLGKGAWGAVYLAFDPKLNRQVAVKVLHREFFSTPKARQRFEREARAIAALRHPNVVELLDFGSDQPERLFLVMEYLQGPHLGLLARDHGPMPETVVAAVGHELCSALTRAHEASIIHRDLKPENVFVVDGRLVLADFGIVKAISESSPLGPEAANPRTDIIGTPGFMAPEQLRHEQLGPYTDIFALGSLMYFLATGSLPIDASSPYDLLRRFRSEPIIPAHERRPVLSAQFSELIGRAMALEPTARYASCEALRHELARLMAERGVTDVREELRRFVGEGRDYVLYDRTRVVARAEERFNDSMAAQRLTEASRWYGVIARLDAVRAQALGMLLRARDTARRRRAALRRAAWVVLGALLGAGLVLAGWRLFVPPRPPPPTTTCQVVADQPTEILYNGQTVGYTPTLRAFVVRPPVVRVVFRAPGKPALDFTVRQVPGGVAQLEVDWQRGTVIQRDAPSGAGPAR